MTVYFRIIQKSSHTVAAPSVTSFHRKSLFSCSYTGIMVTYVQADHRNSTLRSRLTIISCLQLMTLCLLVCDGSQDF